MAGDIIRGSAVKEVRKEHNGRQYAFPIGAKAEYVETDPQRRFVTDEERKKIAEFGEIAGEMDLLKEKLDRFLENYPEEGIDLSHDHDGRYYRIGWINDHDIVFKLNNAVRWQNSAYIQSNRPQELTLAASQEDEYKILYGIRDGSWAFAPNENGMLQLGTAEYGWAGVYSTGGFNSVSDKRLKTDLRRLDGYDVAGFIAELEVFFFRYRDGGDGTYCGLMAQDVERLAEKHGLPDDLSLVKRSPVCNDKGEVTDYRYAIDYQQLIGMALYVMQQKLL